ncbi:MAG: asparagine synthase (glutamine-hydrolyzing) [Acidiferrobacterales bacterium]|nr:asparagine synthase (glutamine-hydrolyzing) [Acidiferrobacterales bacterium]
MCGIVGVLNRRGRAVASVDVQRMNDAITHRGPDGEGLYCHNEIGLGHRRLSIIDLSKAGHQPMASPDSRYVLSYNGEIYNFLELKVELEALGHQFRSRSDTEVVLTAFIEWGESCINRFNGMFAFLLWDNQTRRLFIGRDRYGIKPLYFYESGDSWLFGSEIKGITQHPDYRFGVNIPGLVEYMTFQNFFSDQTLNEGIKMFPAGHFGWVDGKAKSISLHQYWDYEFVEPEGNIDDNEYLEELDRLFVQGVTRQLVSDVDVGSYLSGGIDSGSITAIAAKHFPNLKTFTCGFDLHSASGIELSFDERDAAELMSSRFETEHYEVVLKAGDMERCLPDLVHHLEEPRVGQSYPNYYISRLASKFVKVVLSGAGGDEIFGGYPWRYYRAVVNDDFGHYTNKYYDYWQRLIRDRDRASIFAPVVDIASSVDTREIFESVFEKHPERVRTPEDYVNLSLYMEAKTFMHGLLTVDDKLSMAHSLETRVPFLDNDLVDFAMKLPTRLKLGNMSEVIKINENEVGSKTAKYFQKTKDGKLLLRKMMANHIPAEIVDREKQGFSAPDASWFKGKSIHYVKDVIFSDTSPIFAIFDKKSVRTMVDEHLSGQSNKRLLIWSLLYLNLWLKNETV